MSSTKFFLLITTGVSLLGLCIYYDRKRLSDPQYKRKLHERRLRRVVEQKDSQISVHEQTVRQQHVQHRLQLELFIWMPAVKCLAHPTVLKQLFHSELELGDQLMHKGHLSKGLTHLAKAIMLCRQPAIPLHNLQATMPKALLQPLIIRVSEFLEENRQYREMLKLFSSSDADEGISNGKAW
ncbi:mitochondrial import receptor subunit TOM20 homolog B-like [Drosophila guanche]|uniref:Blast:Mitochondrial import receptor subunit TOM20 homolog n=1 Tax=Drosophila guanche TaxID=7266 RepID=A0A3B0K1X2_DROGU|nr:mitochondrial import receptor subunit TOM20 homolog B-like [Drosophila guanche]SPP79001.1 blast:Mitochondrial import receptor subunit TOM20 homolog [Drosophila guanche]